MRELALKVEECVTRHEIRRVGHSDGLWESIVTDQGVKDRLLRTALLALLIRPGLAFTTTALHGLVLLYGPPGTGKTTLARGLADELASVVTGGKVRLIEISPHGLMSAEHGQSQQLVTELLCHYIPGLADDGMPTVVVLDEVESMCVARSAASLSANPVDVHRSTDAVLTALDHVTSEHRHIVTVATSNFSATLDEAFTSRSDDAIFMPLPNAEAIAKILQVTLKGFGARYPRLAKLAAGPELVAVAERVVGLDGRKVRKLVTDAMKVRKDTVLDPNKLTIADLSAAAQQTAAREASHAPA